MSFNFYLNILLASVVFANPFEFLVMGDWGGQPSSPYSTGPEVATAAAMGKVAAKSSTCNFALALGDNFYDSGVKNVDDTRFKHTFEDVFNADSLQHSSGFNFHVLAGNHDHYGNASAQVAYSSRSERWNFPSLYYTWSVTVPDINVTIQFVMIDTVVLSGNSDVHDEEGHLVQELGGDELPGPASQSAADNQWNWITTTLESSSADYLLVSGHYPVYSICEHGPTSNLIQKLKPLLEEHKVTAYLNGHDHCMEHVSYNGVEYHTIGSAHVNDKSTAHKSNIPKDSLKFHCGALCYGGFAKTSVSSNGLLIEHFDGRHGDLKYSAPLLKPRA